MISIWILYGVGIVSFLLLLFLFVGRPKLTENPEYGVTFSRTYAEDLGLDPNEVLLATLNDLEIKRLRIPAYWAFLEPRQDWWDFSSLDRQIDTIEKNDGKIILAIGEKAPRWPECWAPDWWKRLPREEQKERTLLYLETVVTRYRDRSSIIAWQVENEPHFKYGDCPRPDLGFFKEEVKHVKKADPTRPVMTTDSGELSLWVTFGKSIDALGISTYRVVQNPLIGTWHYWFIPPYTYARKAALVSAFRPDNIYVSEFQMEPWSNKPLPETPLSDQMRTFNLEQMQKNLWYAERMRISPVDFWGVEWWYWMKENNRPEFWNEMKKFLTK